VWPLDLTGDPGMSRRSLARRICEWLGWHREDGRPQEHGAREALAELEKRRVVTLHDCEVSCFRWDPQGRWRPLRKSGAVWKTWTPIRAPTRFHQHQGEAERAPFTAPLAASS